MPVRLGARADRLASVRALRTAKGRRVQGRFAFEGATLLEEAQRAAFPIEELYVTQEAYDATPLVRLIEASGTPCFLVNDASAARISDVDTPSGILAVTPLRLRPLDRLVGSALLLVLADLNDPANAGSLLRSAEAFGADGALFGTLGIDPFHPKVVRGSMGAIFRLAVAVADPADLADWRGAGAPALVGLRAAGAPLDAERWDPPVGIVIGNERHGLGRWEPLCRRFVGIPMRGASESLSAAVAGSIALYEASRRRAGVS